MEVAAPDPVWLAMDSRNCLTHSLKHTKAEELIRNTSRMDNHRTAPHIKVRLAVMMFLQYAIWGAWLPLLFFYVTSHLQWTPGDFGTIAALGACGAILGPFISGQIADRYFATERFLAVSHAIGGLLVWSLASIGPQNYTAFCVLSFFYGLVYAPTIPLTNSICFHNLKNTEREFGAVRVWGTIGWIVVGIAMGHWLLHVTTGLAADQVLPVRHAAMADSFKLSAILGWVLAVFCLLLPHTPPRRSAKRTFAPLAAISELRKRSMWVLFLVAFPISVVHQFYFVHTAPFLEVTVNANTEWLVPLFGAGGVGLMTIGQIGEIVVLACMPFILRRWSKKNILLLGLLAYITRFAIFAFVPHSAAIVPALALHGLCFGCFFFVAFIIVDEESGSDVRASAQGLFNFIVVGVGIIAGNLFAGQIGDSAVKPEGGFDYVFLFAVPLAITVASAIALLLLYPAKAKAAVTQKVAS